MSADYEMNFKRICVKLEDDTTIKGKINVTNYPRVSDMLKHSTDPFITIISDDQADTAKKAYVIHKKYGSSGFVVQEFSRLEHHK